MALYSLDGTAPRLDADIAFVAESAAVIGDVALGPEVSVWFGAVLRGDNEPIAVGARTNIQENAVLHTDPGFPLTIGEGCTIGHGAIVHGATVGAGTLVGMGATILNGARIGEHCLIGAGALVTENKVIAPRSLVLGAPGKVVRTLSDEEVERLARSAETYVRNGRRFAAGLATVPHVSQGFDPA